VVVTIYIQTTHSRLRELKLLPWLQNGCHPITIRHVCGINEQDMIFKEEHSPIKLLLKMVRYNPQATKISGQEDIILL